MNTLTMILLIVQSLLMGPMVVLSFCQLGNHPTAWALLLTVIAFLNLAVHDLLRSVP